MALTQRLFIGLELPPEAKATLRALDPGLPKLRWLPEEQIHLTFNFLGDVAAPVQERLVAALEKVRVQPFLLPLQGVGSFNAQGRPSVVWAGVGRGHPHLFLLQRRLQDALLQTGLKPDLRPFRPHITVARSQGISKEELKTFLRTYAETEFGVVPVSEYLLFASELEPSGATHRIEQRFAL